MPLEQEQHVYARELPNLLASRGKYVLIHGDQIVSLYDTYADALKGGYDRFGLKPFLVKRIQPTENVQFFMRGVTACRP